MHMPALRITRNYTTKAMVIARLLIKIIKEDSRVEMLIMKVNVHVLL